MARKQKIAPSFAPITIEIANAIKAAFSAYQFGFAFNRDISIECVSAADDMTDYDHVYLDAEGCRIVVAVGTGEIPYPGNPIPTNNYGKVMAYGYILEAPGVVCREKMKLKGTLELDYTKPEAKIHGCLYLDMLAKAIKIKRTIEAALAEEIV